MERPHYEGLFKAFAEKANPELGRQMSAYMRGQFPFLGLPTPVRRQLSREFLKSASSGGSPDWDFIRRCWEKPPREFQYLGVDYLSSLKDTLTPRDIPRLKELILAKSWWDTIDGLDRIAGHIALSWPRVNRTLLEWSRGENIWLRRVAIDHQLGRKEKTDPGLLEEIIKNNLGQKDFFIRKAIGWSLREYSKTNPSWVRDFLARHAGALSPLSRREGGKYL
ncbi:MAG: DNA alkylation repair protein [Spirochaetales bacterium]|nr:DNA alkylation repair protein [Spirochaetales bacterium]